MKLLAFAALLAAASLSGCAASGLVSSNAPTNTQTRNQSKSSAPVMQFKLATDSKYPTVVLKEYTLISDDLERDRRDADAVIRTKAGLPYAMQTKQRADFEGILAKNFTFRGESEFFDREGYISNRVGDPAKVKQADYRNVVVQFFGERALVTYSNIVEDQPGGPGSWKADMTWADVFAKDDGQWKYETVHLIEFRDLTTSAKK